MNKLKINKKKDFGTLLLFVLLNVAWVTNAYAWSDPWDFREYCSSGQRLYYRITDEENRQVTVRSPYESWPGIGYVDEDHMSGLLVIPSSVTHENITYTVVGIENAFGGYGTPQPITSVVIPNTVTFIGGSAFSGCTELTGNLNLPDNLTSIGTSAFEGCTGLSGNLIIPNTVTEIGWYAFKGCSGFTGNLTIPNSVETVGEEAFINCTGWNGTLTIGESVQGIGGNAFYNTNFTTLNYNAINFRRAENSSPQSDDNWWIGSSPSLTTLNIGDKVDHLPHGIFRYCHFTGDLTIPNAVTFIGHDAFYHCDDFDGVLTIGESVASIEYNVFQYTNFSQVNYNATHCGFGSWVWDNGPRCPLHIGENVTIIPNDAFTNGRFTGSVVIPNSVATIGHNAFKGCSGITSLTIGEGVTSIEPAAFSDCTSLATVNYNAINCANEFSYHYDRDNGVFGNCPSLTTLNIGDNVEVIPGSAFSFCSFTDPIVIPNSVTTIGSYAFYKCANITSVTIGEGLVSTSYCCFKGCTSLSSVIYNAINCSSIGYDLWYGCTSLQTLTIGPKVQHLTANIFKNNSFTGELVLPNSLVTIENEAFSGCTGFTGDLIIPENVTYIGENAFYGCTGFTGDLTIGNSVIQINAHAFDNCSGFTGALTIGESFEGVFNNWNEIFARCSGLTTLNYNAINANVDGFYWLTGCTSLTTLNIGPNVEVIPGGAFKDLNFNNDIVIPNSVTTIKNGAFNNCDNITSITIGENVTTMEGWSFTGCDNISVVNYNAVNCNEGNTSIKSNWIDSKNNLTTLNIGGNVRKIFNGAFADMQFTGNLVLPNTLESIGEEAFRNCHSFTGDLVIPNSVTSIGKRAFYDCSGFNGTLTIGKNVANIGFDVFCNAGFTALVYNAIHSYTQKSSSWIKDCNSMTNLTIGTEVEVLPECIFHQCNKFTGDLIIPNSVTMIEKDAFNDCNGFTGTLTLSDNITTIGESAFVNCWRFIGPLTLPAGLKYIENDAFRNCHSFTGDLVIPEGALTIGYKAFHDCYGMEGVLTIASSVTSIGNESFKYTRFHTLNYNAINATVDGNDWLSNTDMMITLNIGNQVQVIPDNAFNNRRFAGTLTLPNSLLAIGANAFYNCDYFSWNLVIPENVATIGNSAFRDCNGFNGTLTLPATMTSIGEAAFKDCRSITGTLTIPEGITVIEKETFREMSSLTGGIVIPNSVVEIKDQAFINCRQLNGNLVLSSSLETIGDEAFQDCYNMIGSLSLPSSLVSVGAHAFRYCRGFTGDLALPNSITGMGEGAFQECYGFNGTLTLPDSIETLQKEVFRNCHGFVGSLVIPNSVTNIQNGAFRECYGFDEQLVIGEMVDRIYDEAFVNARNFQSIRLRRDDPPALASNNIFWYWDMTKPVYVPCGKVEAYASSGYWTNFTNIQEFGCSTIEITASANNPDYGTVSGAGFFADGEICSLVATPNIGYAFVNWTENNVEVSTDAEYSFTVTGDRNLVANFAIQTFEIVASVNNSDCGTVTGGGTFDYGATATLTATPNTGYTFINWTENGVEVSTDAEYSFTVEANRNLVANFAIQTFEITVSANNSDYGTVTGGGTFDYGTMATLTATPNTGYTFINWTENDVEVSTDAEYGFTVTESRNLVANFDVEFPGSHWVPNPSLYADNMSIIGIIQLDGEEQRTTDFEIGAFCGDELRGSQRPQYISGIIDRYMFFLTVYGQAMDQITFKLYDHSTNEELNLTSPAAITFAANGTIGSVGNPHAMNFTSVVVIAASCNPSNAGVITGAGDYPIGADITLTASANTGFAFKNWTCGGNIVSTDPSYAFTVSEAMTFVANFDYLQSRELTSGWNWYSTYIDVSGSAGLAMMENGLGSDAMQIKSQTAFVTYEYGKWYGALTSADAEQMYMIQMNDAHVLNMTGSVADVSAHPITINTGWKWIGYPVNQSMSIDAALANFTPHDGDYIKSQTGFSQYYEGLGWLGALNTLSSGDGYMYQNTSGSAKTLVYATPGKSDDPGKNITPRGNHWEPDIYQYANNMSVVASVSINGEIQNSENIEVAAFCNGECRGSAKPMFIEQLDKYLMFLTVYGNENDEISFRLFDAENNEEFPGVSDEMMTFTVNGTVGSVSAPYTINFGFSGIGETSDNSINIYPNPTTRCTEIRLGEICERVEIFNSVGTKISEYQNVNRIKGFEVAGIYVIRITNGELICNKKLIIK
ncbi:MAG: leucine-rich repeat protein [Bacteroidales bacterium]|nr:leucine-rich repeat protein [Bacteroidales bacterium]